MNVSLTPHLEEYVKAKVESGLYNSSSEVVREALRLMGERDRLRDIRVDELRKEIRIGIDQADRGEFVELDSRGLKGFFDDIRAEGRQMLEEERRA